MRDRRLSGSMLLLGLSLLLVAGQSHGQGLDAPPPPIHRDGAIPEVSAVIATSVPVTTQTPSAPAPLPPMPGTIQQAVFVPGSSLDAQPIQRTGGNGLIPDPVPPPSAGPTSTGLMSGLPTPKPPSGSPNPLAALVSVEVVGPAQLSLGQPLTHEIVVRNAGSSTIAEVHVEEPLAGLRVLHSEPPGLTKGDRLTWNLGILEGGAERRLKVEAQPAGSGELHLRPYVTFLSGGGLRTRVIRPPFGVEMTADRAKTTCGGRITFRIRVSNHGDALVRNVKLFDRLPAGLSHPAGRIVGITRFGDLQPGETKTIALETTAIQAGEFRNEIVVHADGGLEAHAHVDGVVTEPSLTLRVDGPKQGVTRRELDFHVEVTNPGPGAAKKIRLVQALPPSFETVAASTGASLDAAQHALLWTLGDLAAGQRQVITFRVKATTAGDWPLYTSVLADNIPETRLANVLRIEGASALTVELRAVEDRLTVGQETVYEMHVFNRGDAPCAGVRLAAWLPDEVTPLSAEGPMTGQVQKQQVSFPPIAQLPSGGDTVYRVRVRGQRPGNGSVRVELTAERQAAVQREMSIQVSGGSPAMPLGKNPLSGGRQPPEKSGTQGPDGPRSGLETNPKPTTAEGLR